MQHTSPFLVRLGLLLISVLVALKAAARFLVRVFVRLLSPFGRFLLRYLVIPVYGIFYGFQRRFQTWYRPAKNRFMFLLSNRYTLHGVVVLIAFVAIGVNLRFETVRAETGTFGERSLLYGIVTQQSVEVIEEYATDFDLGSMSVSYLDESTLRSSTSDAVTVTPGAPMSALLADGTLSTPTSTTTTKDTLAPREGVVTYTVQDGDTLSTIAEKFGISLNTLLWANNLTVRSVIKPGVALQILPVTGVQHQVAKGETLIGIAKKYSVDADQILAYNKLSADDALAVGEKLIVPGGVVQAPVAPPRTIAVNQIFTSTPSTSAPKPAAGGGKMTWPTDLHTVVRGLSWYHTGYDIDCNGHANGTSTNDNYAAADGIVQFAGVKNGYGNVVEINHGNGLVTRYGHFYSLYVTKGQSVTAGTPLGRCGSTGNSTGTHLHFEVIVNGAFKNPYDYLY